MAKTKLSEQIKKANIANIVKKAKAEKVLTSKELEAIESYEEEREILNETGSEFLFPIKKIAMIFGISERQAYRWQNIGLPKEKGNLFDVKKCFKWWVDNIGVETSNKSTNDARERYWAAKAESEEIRIARIKSELIKRDDVFSEFAQRASDLKTGLRALKYRLSGLLVGKDQDEIMNILGVEIDSMLRNFCRQGKYIEGEETPAKKTVKTKKKTTKTKAKPKKKTTAKKSTRKAVKK